MSFRTSNAYCELSHLKDSRKNHLPFNWKHLLLSRVCKIAFCTIDFMKNIMFFFERENCSQVDRLCIKEQLKTFFLYVSFLS